MGKSLASSYTAHASKFEEVLQLELQAGAAAASSGGIPCRTVCCS